MSVEGRGKLPYKVWDSGRQIRKGLVASNFTELVERAREKLELGDVRLRVVLEADGTQVEDPEYFCTLPENTVFLLLRQGEHWYPAGVEALKQGTSSSPRKPSLTTRVIVSGIGESTKTRHEFLTTQTSFGSTPSPIPGAKSPIPSAVIFGAGGSSSVHGGTVTTIHRDGKKETLINDVGSSAMVHSHQSTVINHEGDHKSSFASGTAALIGRLSRQGSSVESAHSATVHIHTPECCSYGHPTPTPKSRVSPTGEQSECDFHCCSLHEEGGRIQSGRHYAQHHQHHQHHQATISATTSPTQEEKKGQHIATTGKQNLAAQKGSHVRFLSDYHSTSTEKEQQPQQRVEPESSESETENTTNDDDGQTCMKFLLLIDQPATEQATKKHLSIKDIGVILDRLSSKIVDVERLNRDAVEDCFNWTIKATIRGDNLQELGVLYGGHYYTICEHPSYGESTSEEEKEESQKDSEEPV